MSLCINPNCSHPENENQQLFCQACGSELLLAGRYQVVRLLSDKGGFGNTYEVSHNHQLKVLKVLTNNHPKAIELFQKEADVLAQLNHPGIPKGEGSFNYFPRNSQTPLYCLVMEKIEGMDLEEYQKQRNNQPIDQILAIEWLLQVINILHEVHSHNFFHRDIKPSNIILRTDGQLTLIDFGAVRQVTATILGGGQNTGIFTPGFAPPEQEKGYAVPQSDFYALGRTFVYLLTGKSPIHPEIYDRYNDTLNWRGHAPQIIPELADFIDYLMADKANNRPQSTTLILEYLRQLEAQIKPSSQLPIKTITKPIIAPTLVSKSQNIESNPVNLSGYSINRRKALTIMGISAGSLLLAVGIERYLNSRENDNNLNHNNSPDQTTVTTVTVALDYSGDYSSITDAINNVSPHTIIKVKAGLYEEFLMINKPLEIIGEGVKEAVIIQAVNSPCLRMETQEAVVKNISFKRLAGATETEGYTIDIPQGKLVLENCDITSESFACLGIYGVNTTPEIKNCSVHSSIKDCGFYFYDQAKGVVSDCQVYDHGLSGFAIARGADPVIKNCQIYQCQGNGIYSYEKGKGMIENCEIYSHTFHGVVMDNYALLYVNQCNIYNNNQVGILCYQNGVGTIDNSSIYQNVYSGVEIRENGNLTVTNCQINQNQQHALYAHDQAYGKISNCDLTGNGFEALNIDTTSQIEQSNNLT